MTESLDHDVDPSSHPPVVYATLLLDYSIVVITGFLFECNWLGTTGSKESNDATSYVRSHAGHVDEMVYELSGMIREDHELVL